MKTQLLRLLAVAALVCSAPLASAHETIQAGPNGGRLLTKIQPRAEFLLTAERKVQITFVGADGKPIAPAEQVVTVTTGNRAAPIKLSFSKTGTVLLSDAALPPGNDFPTVVQIKANPEAKAAVARFNLNTATCSGCKKPEYVCTCGH
jgi:hypothetical protein